MKLLICFLFGILSLVHSETLKPIQIITANAERKLEAVETSLEILEAIKVPIAVVSVTGPIHSGKSFLVTQLTGNTKGFKIGYSTDPEPMGLWVSPPQYRQGDTEAIIFLDSEGLFAPNVTEDYDAKIFSISALISSYLIYNTIGNIDQSAIDFLELLARRAQLFGIKAQMDFLDSVEALKFPPLLWIVRDFHLDTEGKTPKEWLSHLLEPSDNSLVDFFQRIDCQTLPLPQKSKHDLQFLDQAQTLAPDFVLKMKSVREQVLKAPVKMRGKVPVTGSDLAELIRALVSAANTNIFPVVPSIWDGFLKIASNDAEQEALRLYERTFSDLLKNEVFTTAEFDEVAKKNQAESLAIFHKMTFGLQDHSGRLLDELKKREDKKRDLNAANMLHHIGVEFDRVRERFNAELRRLKLPVPSAELQSKGEVLIAVSVKEHSELLEKFSNEDNFHIDHNRLPNVLEGDFAEKTLANKEEISNRLERVVEDAKQAYIESLRDSEDEAQSVQSTLSISQKADEAALRTFDKEGGWMANELGADLHLSHLTEEKKREWERFINHNNKLVLKEITPLNQERMKHLQEVVNGVATPKTVSLLRKEAEDLKRSLLEQWKKQFEKYKGFDAYEQCLAQWQEFFDSCLKAKEDENGKKFLHMFQKVEEKFKRRTVEYTDGQYILYLPDYKRTIKSEMRSELTASGLQDEETQDTLMQKFFEQTIPEMGVWLNLQPDNEEGFGATADSVIRYVIALVNRLLSSIFG